jgi:hypothetical protein
MGTTYHLNSANTPHDLTVQEWGPARDGRQRWRYQLATGDQVIFSGDRLETPADATADEAARGALGFATLRPGDTDHEYFDGYTATQTAWVDEHAEELGLALYTEDGDDVSDLSAYRGSSAPARRLDHLTEEEWAQSDAGKCTHQVSAKSFDQAEEYCDKPRDLRSPYDQCAKHDREVYDESPTAWDGGSYVPPEHPYSLGYDDGEAGKPTSSNDPDYLDGHARGAEDVKRDVPYASPGATTAAAAPLGHSAVAEAGNVEQVAALLDGMAVATREKIEDAQNDYKRAWEDYESAEQLRAFAATVRAPAAYQAAMVEVTEGFSFARLASSKALEAAEAALVNIERAQTENDKQRVVAEAAAAAGGTLAPGAY